jgi:hypothetical protein
MAVDASLVTLFRYVDRRVFAELELKERETFGFSPADVAAS